MTENLTVSGEIHKTDGFANLCNFAVVWRIRRGLELMPSDSYTATLDPPPFADFRAWFTRIVEEVRPELVVCIARSALRLMQLHQAADLLSNVQIVTQHTLPFLPDMAIADRRILIFDDSIIYGSTMSGVYTYLISRRGAPVCAAYVADRLHFFGEGQRGSAPSPHVSLPLHVKHRLPPALVTQHHDALIQAVLSTSLEYNPDFSSASFELLKSDDVLAAWLPLALRRHGLVKDVVEISSTTAIQNGLHRYTVFLQGSTPRIFSSNNVAVGPYSKLRFCLNRYRGVLRSTALAQVRMRDPIVPSEIEFSDEVVQIFWHRLSFPARVDDPFWAQGVFRLTTAFASTVLNSQIARDVSALLGPDYDCAPGEFGMDDLTVILTSANVEVLRELFSELIKRPAPLQIKPAAESTKLQKAPIDVNEEPLAAAILNLWRSTPQLAPEVGETAYEALAKTFLSLHEVTDNDRLRRANPTVSRLNVGLTYPTIDRLLADRHVRLAPDDLSLALDICVDHGQAVPRVLCDDGVWHRAFYSGENRHSIDPAQFKSLFFKAYVAHLTDPKVQPLSPFLCNKFCATLKDLFPRLPLSTKFRTFGKVALIGSDELVPWMTSSAGAPLQHSRVGNTDVLRPNPHFIAAVEPAWDAHESRNFADAFSFVATAYDRVSSEGVLLLSTCRTQRHYYCAVAVEAHQWADRVDGFGDLLDELEVSVATGGDNHKSLIHLYYCCRYIQEIARKTAVFTQRFRALTAELRRAFLEQGSAGARFWEHMIERSNLLDESVLPDVEDRLALLGPIVVQMRALTAYATRFLIEGRLVDSNALRQVFESQGASVEWERFNWLLDGSAVDAVRAYNRGLSELSAGRSLLTTRLDEKAAYALRDTSPIDQIHTMRDCFAELRSALVQLCPRYVVEEGNEFEFAPDYSKRILPDGTIERYLPDQYILALDIVGSTDSDAAAQLKNNILAILDRNTAKGVRFATAGDDKYVVCHASASVLWDVAVMIQVDGAMLAYGKMLGARKGLFFGGITLQEKPDGRILIIDTVTPHVIPRAVGILDAATKSAVAKVRGQNAVIVVDYFAAQRAADELKLDLEDAERVEITAKHYSGSCYIFETIKAH